MAHCKLIEKKNNKLVSLFYKIQENEEQDSVYLLLVFGTSLQLEGPLACTNAADSHVPTCSINKRTEERKVYLLLLVWGNHTRLPAQANLISANGRATYMYMYM